MNALTAWSFLIFAVVFNTIGNLVVKKAGMAPVVSKHEVFFSLTFMIGAACFALNLLGYTLAQRGLSISIAYPVLIGLSMIGVAIGAQKFFSEPINLTQVGGMTLIVVGIVIVSYFGGSS